MKKAIRRKISILLAAVLLLGAVPMETWAEEPTDEPLIVQEEELPAEKLTVEQEEIQTVEAQEEASEQTDEEYQEEDSLEVITYEDLFGYEPEEEEILAGYFERETLKEIESESDLLLDEEPQLFSSDMLKDRLTYLEQAMYDALKSMADDIQNGRDTVTKISLTLSTLLGQKYWTAEDLGLDSLSRDGELSAEAIKAIEKIADYSPMQAIRAVLRDCPYEFFWAENFYLHGSGEKSYALKLVDGTEVLYFKTDKLTVHIPVSLHYQDTTKQYQTVTRNGVPTKYYVDVDPNKLALPRTAAQNAAAVVNAAAGYSLDKKLEYFRDAICKRNVYNTEAAVAGADYDNRDPWQLIYLFDEDPATNVVCEGYAKGFQYLCELSGETEISVYSVTGDLWQGDRNLGGHMWNIVRMKDGTNYLVDLTNVDGESLNNRYFKSFPDSGSVEEGYTFAPLRYVYSAETKQLYTEQELKLGPAEYKASVNYRTHVQTHGDQKAVKDGAVSGTYGESKRLEGIWIGLDTNADMGVRYTTHVQTYGWLDPVTDQVMSGTSGESKRLEAIMIELYGKDADKFDIFYRVHAQSYGWLGWAKNGEPAGTAGYAKRLEGIQIVVTPKGTFKAAAYASVPGIVYDGTEAYVSDTGEIPSMHETCSVNYRTHVQTYGWQGMVKDGTVSGTSGESKRLEAIEIKLKNAPYSGNIEYCTHVQRYGWLDWVKNGAASGTSGESKRLEAIRIHLTGEMKQHYDIYYRVHAQHYGWLGWAKNGADAGTAGFAYRLEAIQIVLVEKGSAAPKNVGGIVSDTKTPFIEEK